MSIFDEMPKTKNVAFCVPIVNRPYPAFIKSLEASVPVIQAAGWTDVLVQEINNPYISGARSKMLRKALDHGADVIVFLDYDLEWEPQALLDLIETEGEVIAGTYRCKIEEEQYMGTIYSGIDGRPIVRADGCIKAHVAPAGFLKVTKEGVERFMGAFPELCYGPKYHQSVDLFNHGANNGLWWGEDYAFCRRWNEKCGELWIKPDISLTHWMGEKPYPGNFHQYLLRAPGGSESANPTPPNTQWNNPIMVAA